MLLKLKYDKLLSTFAFKFKLRRYAWVRVLVCMVPSNSKHRWGTERSSSRHWRQGLTLVHCSAQPEPFLAQNTP